MNQLIEQAFLAATTATNDGVQVIPALAGLQYRTGTDYKINKPEDDTYIVECNDAENVVGTALEGYHPVPAGVPGVRGDGRRQSGGARALFPRGQRRCLPGSPPPRT